MIGTTFGLGALTSRSRNVGLTSRGRIETKGVPEVDSGGRPEGQALIQARETRFGVLRHGMVRFGVLGFGVLLFGAHAGAGPAQAQLTPVRATEARPMELTFPTPRNINLATPEPLSKGEFYYSIMHTFGEVQQGAGTFWGIDSGANVRFSMEYGMSDRASVVLARSSLDRVYEMGARVRLLSQMVEGSPPVSVSIQVSGGILTLGEDILGESPSFLDRTHVAVALPVSWGEDGLSLLVVPMSASFSRTFAFQRVGNPADLNYVGVGVGARLKRGRTASLTGQVLPTYGITSGDRSTVLGFGVDLETGGHVFQMYLTNSQALNDAYLLAAPVGSLKDGGLRFGFNVNRSFQLF